MLEALLAAAAEAVFSYILDTLEPAERLRDWLKRSPAKLAHQRALARTCAAFARQSPEFTAYLFNRLLSITISRRSPIAVRAAMWSQAYPWPALIG
jgi:hypothetical protein